VRGALGRPWTDLPCWAACLWVLRRLGHPVEPEELARPERWRELPEGTKHRLGDIACGEGDAGLHVAALYDLRAGLWLTSTHRRGVHGVSMRALRTLMGDVGVYRWEGAR